MKPIENVRHVIRYTRCLTNAQSKFGCHRLFVVIEIRLRASTHFTKYTKNYGNLKIEVIWVNIQFFT